MSSATTARPTVPRQQRAVPAAAEERGRTTIRDRVVARIAGRAAAGVPGVRTTPGTMAALVGSGPGRARTRGPRVRVRRSGDTVLLRLGITLGYPHPARRTTRDVRERVRREVETLTGLRVRGVDIEIVELVRETRA